MNKTPSADPRATGPSLRLGRVVLVLIVLGIMLVYPLVLIEFRVPIAGVVTLETAVVLLALSTARRVLILVGVIRTGEPAHDDAERDAPNAARRRR
jgi:hypothetical protein